MLDVILLILKQEVHQMCKGRVAKKDGRGGGMGIYRLEITGQNNTQFYLISEGDFNIVRYKSFIRLIRWRGISRQESMTS